MQDQSSPAHNGATFTTAAWPVGGWRSIRWRLPLSYAAIACLAALALGAVLIETVRDHYDTREEAFLVNNADAFAAMLSSVMAQDVDPVALANQVENLGFFSNARLQVYTAEGDLVMDSGRPDEPRVVEFAYSLGAPGGGRLQVQSVSIVPLSEYELASDDVISQLSGERSGAWGGNPLTQILNGVSSVSLGDADIVLHDWRYDDAYDWQYRPFRLLTDDLAFAELTSSSGPRFVPRDPPPFSLSLQVLEPEAPGDPLRAISLLPGSRSLYGFDWGRSPVQDIPDGRSDKAVRRPIPGPSGNNMGYVVLSDGPAYGSEIVANVARGWLLASGVAVLLAAGAGWVISRQITRPLRELAQVTAHMTEGDLSARAHISRRDELGALAASFNTMAARIEQTVETLRRFVADAAHELHTPITALRTNLELITAPTASTPPALLRAQQQVARLEALTDDLLDLSRIEAGSHDHPVEPVDLVALLHEVSEVYASRAEQAGTAFELETAPGLRFIPGQAAQLRRLLCNLLDNAVKFTPPGGTIRVSLGRHGAGRVVLHVQDSGIGIPREDLPLLFQRFRRGRNATAYPGSGLGLAIVKAIVTRHHGSVTAHSSGEGTCFVIHLPLPSSQKADLNPAEPPEPALTLAAETR